MITGLNSWNTNYSSQHAKRIIWYTDQPTKSPKHTKLYSDYGKQPPQPNIGRGGKRKTSQNSQDRSEPQLNTSNGSTNPASAFQYRNLGTGWPHIQCSGCGEYDHFRKDCRNDNFYTMCISRSHATHMCRTPLNMGKNPICVYCGSTQHTLGSCTSWPSDNREEPRSTPWDLHSHGSNRGGNTENSGLPQGNQAQSANLPNTRPASTENLGRDIANPNSKRQYSGPQNGNQW